MPNNQAQDRYNPEGIGSEFEQYLFEEINEGEIFRLEPNNNSDNVQYRKENENQAFMITGNTIHDVGRRVKVYVKI